jgi:alkanesulfonate monooxygenase SsuD/methylene tetrahydromethanopterin reductase-like flavin-dependent oxidoreductase (luciferase family)
MVATADHLSGGRITLGVGTGYLRGEFEILGVDYAQRGAITDEFLDVVRVLWSSSDTAAYHGTHFEFDDAVFGPAPAQDPVPLWVGGNGRRARRRAAAKGNGWHPLFPTPEEYAAGRADILARRTPGSAFTFSYSCAVTTILDRTPPTYVTDTWGELEEIPEDFSYAPAVPMADDGRPRFVGTPDLVAADIEAYVAAGVEHFTLRFAHGGSDVGVAQLLGQMERFMTEIAPRFSGIIESED